MVATLRRRFHHILDELPEMVAVEVRQRDVRQPGDDVEIQARQVGFKVALGGHKALPLDIVVHGVGDGVDVTDGANDEVLGHPYRLRVRSPCSDAGARKPLSCQFQCLIKGQPVRLVWHASQPQAAAIIALFSAPDARVPSVISVFGAIVPDVTPVADEQVIGLVSGG
ncbi:hypothetical protein D3C87_1431490 [compost metagenome]